MLDYSGIAVLLLLLIPQKQLSSTVVAKSFCPQNVATAAPKTAKGSHDARQGRALLPFTCDEESAIVSGV